MIGLEERSLLLSSKYTYVLIDITKVGGPKRVIGRHNDGPICGRGGGGGAGHNARKHRHSCTVVVLIVVVWYAHVHIDLESLFSFGFLWLRRKLRHHHDRHRRTLVLPGPVGVESSGGIALHFGTEPRLSLFLFFLVFFFTW